MSVPPYKPPRDPAYPCLVDVSPGAGYVACDQCGAHDGTPLVNVGHPIDYANGDARLCEACLRAALALLTGRADR